MKRRIIWAVVILLIIAAGVAAWFLLVKPRFFPSKPAPTDQTGGPGAPNVKPALPDDYNSAVNLYVAGPDDASANIGRVELTLSKAEVTRADGKTFKIFEGSTKLVVQKNVSEKLLNETLPAGKYGNLTLTFLPTGTIVAVDGTAQTTFLPNRVVTIDLKTDLPISRTLTALVRLDLGTARFGVQSNVPTYQLPTTLTDESYILGGIFRNVARVGSIWDLSQPTLAAEVQHDINFDIAPKQVLPGSPSYTPPTAPPNPAPTN